MPLRIISRNQESFKNRQEAGIALAEELKELAQKDAVVLGIPCGGIIVADQVSRKLCAALDVVLSRKIGAPQNPELAIGSLGEDGKAFINAGFAFQVGADKRYIASAKAKRLAEILERKRAYRKIIPKIHLKQRQVILVDDGLATGATMQAALFSIRQEKPAGIIAAVPVASKEGLELIEGYADLALCLRIPEYFAAVGQFYREFPQVSDEEALAILKQSRKAESGLLGEKSQ